MMIDIIEKKAKAMDLSLNELSKKAGLGKNTIYELKSGRNKEMKFSTACKIADTLGVDVSELREE